MNEGGQIIRTVFGTSHKEAETISMRATKGNLEFTSPDEVRFHGKEGGKKFGNFEKKKEDKPLKVTKVEGPFDENGKKATIIKKGEYYTFKATPSRKPSNAEAKLMKWAIKYDNGNIKELVGFSAYNKLIDGKIIVTFKTSEDFEKAKVYAYFIKASEKVSVEITFRCQCCGDFKVVISGLNEISSYKGEFPSPFQIMNYTPSKTERLLHQIYVPDSTIRQWIKEAAVYHGIPHEMLAVILQQENAPKASKWKQFLQFGERTLTTTAAQIDQSLWDLFPDKVADGSAGFMNMRRPTLKSTIKYTKENYCKKLMPSNVAERIGYLYDSNVDEGIQGSDWRADLYYGAAHIRELIDRVMGKCSNGNISLEQVEKVFISYNGSGVIANKYGKDAITLLKNASEGKQILYFYEK
jgi:hypothetical protein